MHFWAAICTDAGLVQATHTGGCGFCNGLGMTLRAGISMCSPLNPVKGSSIMQRIATSSASSHWARLSAGSIPKPPNSPIEEDSPGAELDPSIRDQVERGDAFGYPGRMVDGRRQVHDAESQPNVLGPLAGRGQKHLWCGGMAVLLQEVVLGQPDRGEAGLVGGLDLVETVLQQDVLVVRLPGAG